MQRVKKIALETSPVPIRWWKRYVDDSNACLKQRDITSFDNHLNSINPHIQFTIETPTINNSKQYINQGRGFPKNYTYRQIFGFYHIIQITMNKRLSKR